MKRYLNTPEEVIRALKEGKVVKGKDYKYKLIDGIICSLNEKQGCHRWTVGDTIFDSETPHIEELEPIKLEVGKFYRTRNGKKTFVFAKITNYSYPFYVATVGELNAYSVNAEGRQTNSEPLPLDLVAPWEE